MQIIIGPALPTHPPTCPYITPRRTLKQIDPTVAVSSVGIDKFVLIDRDAANADGSGGVFLRLTIPTRSIVRRACEVGANGEHDLTVTCYESTSAAKAGGVSKSFTVVLRDGGAAKTPLGVALPSVQSQGLLFPLAAGAES